MYALIKVYLFFIAFETSVLINPLYYKSNHITQIILLNDHFIALPLITMVQKLYCKVDPKHEQTELY